MWGVDTRTYHVQAVQRAPDVRKRMWLITPTEMTGAPATDT